MLLQSQNPLGNMQWEKYKTYFFLPPQNGKWYCLTHVILPVDYGVVVCWAAGVSLHGFYVISAVGCVDGSLKLTLQHRAVAGRSIFTCGKRPCGQYNVKQCKRERNFNVLPKPTNKTMWWKAKKFSLTKVYKNSRSYTPSSVPEYTWERSADVDPFSVLTVKSSEKPAASGFSCRRKVLEERDTNKLTKDFFLSVGCIKGPHREEMNDWLLCINNDMWKKNVWGDFREWIWWSYLWKAVKSSCRRDVASLLALRCFLWRSSLSYDSLS